MKSASSDERLGGRVPPPPFLHVFLACLILTWPVMLHIVLCAKTSFWPSPSNSVGGRQLNASCLEVILVGRELVLCFESPSSHDSCGFPYPASTGAEFQCLSSQIYRGSVTGNHMQSKHHLHTQENAPRCPSILAISHSQSEMPYNFSITLSSTPQSSTLSTKRHRTPETPLTPTPCRWAPEVRDEECSTDRTIITPACPHKFESLGPALNDAP